MIPIIWDGGSMLIPDTCPEVDRDGCNCRPYGVDTAEWVSLGPQGIQGYQGRPGYQGMAGFQGNYSNYAKTESDIKRERANYELEKELLRSDHAMIIQDLSQSYTILPNFTEKELDAYARKKKIQEFLAANESTPEFTFTDHIKVDDIKVGTQAKEIYQAEPTIKIWDILKNALLSYIDSIILRYNLLDYKDVDS